MISGRSLPHRVYNFETSIPNIHPFGFPSGPLPQDDPLYCRVLDHLADLRYSIFLYSESTVDQLVILASLCYNTDMEYRVYRQMSAQIYKNKNLYVDYSDTNKNISQGWSLVGKEGGEAKVTGETNIINEGFRPGESKEFINGEQSAANDFFGYGNDGTYDDWEARLKAPERFSLADYTGNSRVRGNFREINTPLRDQLPMEKDLQNRVKQINNAMNKYELGDDLFVYRGCSGDLFGGLYEADEIRKNYLGRVVRDRGFVSTSAIKGKQFIKKNIQLKIRVPHGKGRGAFISPLSHYPQEHEFLLKNNSSFRVTNVYSDPAQHHTWVEMDLIT